MHNTLERGFALALRNLGVSILFPDISFNDIIPYGTKYIRLPDDMPSNAGLIRYDELINNEFDDLVMFITCFEVQKDVLHIYRKMRRKPKLVFYSGNPGTYNHYDKRFCNNLIATDIQSYSKAYRGFIKSFILGDINVLKYYPWIDYDNFSYDGPSDVMIFRTFIIRYKELFPDSYNIAYQLMKNIPMIKWDIVEDKSKKETIDLMNNMMANIHIKNFEGYGFAIIESLARGRPCFLYKNFSHKMSYTNWCIEGETAFYFSNELEFVKKANRFILDSDFRHKIQENTARTVRKIINNDEQTESLKKFLENLN